jgi:hypothetical protein
MTNESENNTYSSNPWWKTVRKNNTRNTSKTVDDSLRDVQKQEHPKSSTKETDKNVILVNLLSLP